MFMIASKSVAPLELTPLMFTSFEGTPVDPRFEGELTAPVPAALGLPSETP